jgi:hypothetical protein
MNSEESINAVLNRVIQDAASQRVNFAESANAYTVWADLPNRMQYCGSRETLEAAWKLAGNHPTDRFDLYIVNAEIRPFGILQFKEG